jgi:hypothetical protein
MWTCWAWCMWLMTRATRTRHGRDRLFGDLSRTAAGRVPRVDGDGVSATGDAAAELGKAAAETVVPAKRTLN